MNTLDNKYYKLFADCIPVRGYNRSTICDVTRGKIKLIPNVLYTILTEHRDVTIGEVKKIFHNNYDEEINEYFDFLLENEFIFLCSKEEITMFKDINLSYDTPSIIDNMIIDFSTNSRHDLRKIFTEANEIKCRNIQLRFFDVVSFNMLNEILIKTMYNDFHDIQVLVKYSAEFNRENLMFLMEKYRVLLMQVHSTPYELFKNLNDFENDDRVYTLSFLTQSIDDETHCGIIDPNFFTKNILFFSESLKFNTCLNKKISLDKFGNVKNCPSMSKNYGHHSDVKLRDVAVNSEFTSSWKIHKDTIKVCQDCEFRHMCTDCRAYLSDANDIFSKPLKCQYNPYTCEWST